MRPTLEDLVRMEQNLVALQRSDAPLPLDFYQDLLQLMRWAAVAISVLAGSSAAQAQSIFFWQPRLGEPLPITKQITDKNGKVIGTATMSDNVTVFRNAKGELVGSAVIENGMQTNYDPSGKVLSTGKLEGDNAVIRDSEGNVLSTKPLR